MSDDQADNNNDAVIPEQTIDAALNYAQATDDNHQDGGDQAWQHPGQPLSDDQTNDDSSSDDSNASAEPAHEEVAVPEPAFTAPVPESPAPEHHEPEHQDHNDHQETIEGTEDLVALKKKALDLLSPLVEHLDQTPEERFRTTMMIIQASDDQSKVQLAYDAAEKIEDEKVRAQALLDIVNEINYFTQPNHNQDQ